MINLRQLYLGFFFTCLIPYAALADHIKFTILQVNDVYELTPNNADLGGLSRVATLRKQLAAENPNTYMMLAGDTLSPSALSMAEYKKGETLSGAQMIAGWNAVGLDYAILGNHEFDLPKATLIKRLKESKFTWFAGNVTNNQGQAFQNMPKYIILDIPGSNKTKLKVGIVTTMLSKYKANYIQYLDPIASIKADVNKLKGKVDFMIALTHLSFHQDILLAETIPELKLIMGGHEHENMLLFRGIPLTPIAKADANATSAYIHKFDYNTQTKKLNIISQLQIIDDNIPKDPKAEKTIQHWLNIGLESLKKTGFNPREIITNLPITLKGKDTDIRYRPTNLSKLVTAAYKNAIPEAELALVNSGTIRIDDNIPPGPISGYTLLSILPFRDQVYRLKLSGSQIKDILKKNISKKGRGSYLITSGIIFDKDIPLIDGQPISNDKTYIVATNSYVKNKILKLKSTKPEKSYGDDIQAFMKELQKRFGKPDAITKHQSKIKID